MPIVLVVAVGQVDLDRALAHDRVLVLRDLVALRQVGIEVVLAVEHRAQVDLRVEPEAGAHRLLDAALVDHRQHAGHGGVDQRHLGVGIGAERGRRAGEELGVGDDLGMDFQPEHDFPIAGFAFDQGHDGVNRVLRTRLSMLRLAANEDISGRL